MKIGLVTPYVYPLPGGVNQHVRYLYENLRLHGHDVRIITSSHGLQRASQGDVIRIGKGFSMPANGSVGTVTLSPRYLSQVRNVLEREQFDLLHFHEPFVPFLSLILLRLSTSVNVATFHAYGGFSAAYEFGSKTMGSYAERLHGRIAVSAAARHFIDRFFPGDYKVIPNGVDIARFQRAVPIARWQDGTRNILFVGRFESRKGLLELLRGARGHHPHHLHGVGVGVVHGDVEGERVQEDALAHEHRRTNGDLEQLGISRVGRIGTNGLDGATQGDREELIEGTLLDLSAAHSCAETLRTPHGHPGKRFAISQVHPSHLQRLVDTQDRANPRRWAYEGEVENLAFRTTAFRFELGLDGGQMCKRLAHGVAPDEPAETLTGINQTLATEGL